MDAFRVHFNRPLNIPHGHRRNHNRRNPVERERRFERLRERINARYPTLNIAPPPSNNANGNAPPQIELHGARRFRLPSIDGEVVEEQPSGDSIATTRRINRVRQMRRQQMRNLLQPQRRRARNEHTASTGLFQKLTQLISNFGRMIYDLTPFKYIIKMVWSTYRMMNTLISIGYFPPTDADRRLGMHIVSRASRTGDLITFYINFVPNNNRVPDMPWGTVEVLNAVPPFRV